MVALTKRGGGGRVEDAAIFFGSFEDGQDQKLAYKMDSMDRTVCRCSKSSCAHKEFHTTDSRIASPFIDPGNIWDTQSEKHQLH